MPCIRLFEHFSVEISSMPSCSAFGYMNHSEKKKKNRELETCRQMGDILYVILILMKAVLKEIWR